MGHVISIPHIGQPDFLQPLKMLLYGKQIAQSLTGMIKIGQAVDHGNHGKSCKVLRLFMIKCSDEYDIHISRKHTGCILDRLPPAGLQGIYVQIKSKPSHLKESALEGYPGPCGGFPEHHGHGLSQKGLMRPARP